DALEAVADQAILRGTGARGLRAIIEEVLLLVMYDIPSRDDVAKVVVTEQTVRSNVDPAIVPRTPATRRERRERSAGRAAAAHPNDAGPREAGRRRRVRGARSARPPFVGRSSAVRRDCIPYCFVQLHAHLP